MIDLIFFQHQVVMLQKYLNTRMSPQHAARRVIILMARKFTIAVVLGTNWWEFRRSSVQTAPGQNIVSAVKVMITHLVIAIFSEDVTLVLL